MATNIFSLSTCLNYIWLNFDSNNQIEIMIKFNLLVLISCQILPNLIHVSKFSKVVAEVNTTI